MEICAGGGRNIPSFQIPPAALYSMRSKNHTLLEGVSVDIHHDGRKLRHESRERSKQKKFCQHADKKLIANWVRFP
jgi:hypothetical protein